jgi:GTP-binding protein EngB required for normal cell division
MTPTHERRGLAESSPGLGSYDHAKQRLGQAVRSVKQYAETHQAPRAASECRELLVRLAEDRFHLVVAGQFSRGKTSLMNAMLGTDRLPTGILPLTSVITTVAYGEREEAFVFRDGWSLPQQIPVRALPQFITQEGNPGNEKRVHRAEVRLPAEFLRLGAYLIDTPGVGSAIAANTKTTSAFLPQADAVIFVTGCDSPLSDAELQFLGQVRLHVRKIFVILNKRDLVTHEQEDAVARFARDRLTHVFAGQNIPPLFFISARTALQAKLNGDAEALAQSRLPEFEQHLTQFLKRDKTKEFLRRIADRAGWIAGTLRAELHAASAVTKDAGQLSDFDNLLASRLADAQREQQEVFERLRSNVRLELPRRFDQELSALYAGLGSNLEVLVRRMFGEAQPWDIQCLDDQLAAAAEEISSRIISSFLERHGPPFRALIEGAVKSESTALARALGSIEALTPVASSGQDAIQAASEDIENLARSTPLGFPPLRGDLWRFTIPWWIAALPVIPLRRLAERRCVEQLRKSISAHREELIWVLITAVDHWVDSFARQLDRLMNETVVHQRELIRRIPDSNEVKDLEQLAATLNELTVELDGEPESQQRLSPNERAGPPRSSVSARCLICARVESEVFDYLRKKQYDLSVSEPARSFHAAQGGFCAVHTWQYHAIASPQGVSSAYPAVLFRLSAQLLALAAGDMSAQVLGAGVRRLLPDAGACDLCRLIAHVEVAAGASVLEAIQVDAQRIPPLCLRHLPSVLAQTRDADIGRLLVDEQARVLQRLGEEMQIYSLKRDALRRQLATSQQHEAHRLALERLVGTRYLALPYRDEAQT